MVHVSPHGMPSSKGSGGDSLGSVLLMILVIGGGLIGLMFLLGHCTEHDTDRRAPTTRIDAGPRP